MAPENDEPNRYCARLGIAVPQVEQILARPGVKLYQLMASALLERGARMTLDEVADRLAAAGVKAPGAGLSASLRRSWRALQPIFRDAEGRYGLSLDGYPIERLLRDLDLHPQPGHAGQGEAEEDVVVEQPGPDVPLSEHELAAALKWGVGPISNMRLVAAVLDVHDRPMTVSELAAATRPMLPSYNREWSLQDDPTRYWTSNLVVQDERGRLVLDRAHPDLAKMREAVRTKALPPLRQLARFARQDERVVAARVRRAEDETRLAAAAALRRAVIRLAPENGAPQALTVLDLAERAFTTLGPDGMADAEALLARYDLLIGIDPRTQVESLGLDSDRWKLTDLRPPVKTYRLDRGGRTVALDLAMLMAHSTGISGPPGSPGQLTRLLDCGETSKIRRRLESDAKALAAFYSYGLLHNRARLRWGFVDVAFGVDWAQPGDDWLGSVLRRAHGASAEVDVVAGSAPGWNDPWARAQRVRPVPNTRSRYGFKLKGIEAADVHAIRIVDATGAPDGRTGGGRHLVLVDRDRAAAQARAERRDPEKLSSVRGAG